MNVLPRRLLAGSAAALLLATVPTLPSTVLAAAAPTAPASPVAAARAGTGGTIVYLRGHDVWIARGDGTGAHAVTRNGTRARPYRSPSLSNGGVIAVARGGLVLRLDQRGRVLSSFDPPALRNSAGELLDGAVNDVALSPDGRYVAWSFVRYSCPVGASCLVRYATGYSTSTRYRRAGRSTYFRAPSWVGSGRTLQTGGYGSQVMLHDLGRAPQHWFDDADVAAPSTDLADHELSPNGRWLAAVRGYGADSTIAWYAVSGNAKSGVPPAPPVYTCVTTPDSRHASPTWSPDSSAVAWASSDGIVVQRAAAHCGAQADARLLLRGGRAPDWSPAQLR